MKLYEILPDRLYQRGKPHRHSDQVKVGMLEDKRIGLVVGLVSPPDPFFDAWGGLYLYRPMPDGKFRPELALQLEHIADAVTWTLRQSDIAALVYCEAGRNRSSLLSALIVKRLLGFSGAAALEYVLEKRPNAFSNLEWREYLENA